MNYTYNHFYQVLINKTRVLSEAGEIYLNDLGRAALSACEKLRKMSAHYGSATSFKAALEETDPLTEEERRAAKFPLAALDLAVYYEGKAVKLEHYADFLIQELRDADDRGYNDLLSLCIEAANLLEAYK